MIFAAHTCAGDRSCRDSGSVTLANLQVGGGLVVHSNSSVLLEDGVVIAHNTAHLYGGAVFVHGRGCVLEVPMSLIV